MHVCVFVCFHLCLLFGWNCGCNCRNYSQCVGITGLDGSAVAWRKFSDRLVSRFSPCNVTVSVTVVAYIILFTSVASDFRYHTERTGRSGQVVAAQSVEYSAVGNGCVSPLLYFLSGSVYYEHFYFLLCGLSDHCIWHCVGQHSLHCKPHSDAHCTDPCAERCS